VLGTQAHPHAPTPPHRYIEGLIEQEVASGIPTSKVLVAGFSQGGAVSLLMLRSQHQLAGVIGLSTYLPLREEPPIISEANKQTPVLMCHGDTDQVVAYNYGKQSYEKLQEAGCAVQFKTYPGMGHSACPQELEELKKFITEKLSS
jgi:lysophospholipase-2